MYLRLTDNALKTSDTKRAETKLKICGNAKEMDDSIKYGMKRGRGKREKKKYIYTLLRRKAPMYLFYIA